MHNINVTDCKTALARLMDGNEEYINSKTGRGNISDCLLYTSRCV